MLFSQLFAAVDPSYLYCIVLSGRLRPSSLSSPFTEVEWPRTVVRIHRFFFFFYFFFLFLLTLQKAEPKIIRIIPTDFVLFGYKLQTSKISQKQLNHPMKSYTLFLSNTSFQSDMYNQVCVSCGLDYIRCFQLAAFPLLRPHFICQALFL